MSKIIFMKCPQCGAWCVAEHKGLLHGAIDRFKRAWNKSVEDAASVGMAIGKSLSFGNEKVSEFTELLGAAAGGAVIGYTGSGVYNGIKNVIAGDKFQFECQNCNYQWSTDDEADDQVKYYEKEQELINIRDNFRFKDKGEYKQLLSQLQKSLQSDDNTNEALAVTYDMIAVLNYHLGDTNKAIDSINNSLRLFDDSASHTIKGMIETKRELSPYSVLKDLVYYKQCDNSYYFKEQELKVSYEEQEQKYINSFLSIDPDKRRFIYLASELAYLPNSFLVLPYNHLPKTIEFRGCVPTLNTLYIMHPYKNDCYIPAKNFETELFRDEMYEFIHIMECLGAEEIKFTDTRTDKFKQQKQKDRAAQAGVEYKGNKVGAGGSAHNDGTYKNDLHDEFGTEKRFDLSQEIAPYIPNDVVWLNCREEWRRSCKSRLEGRLRHDTYKVFTQMSELISEAQKNTINADIKAMNAHVEGSYEGFDSFSEQTETTHLWECEVKFYPLSEYKETKVVQLVDNIMPSAKKGKINWLIWIMGGVIAALVVAVILLLVL